MTEQQWVSAAEALRLYDKAVPSRVGGGWTEIPLLAKGGVVRARARLFIHRSRSKQDERLENADLPHEFWWAAGGEALEAKWEIGSFTTWIDNNYKWEAFGVEFLYADLVRELPASPNIENRKGEAPEALPPHSQEEYHQWIREQPSMTADDAHKIYKALPRACRIQLLHFRVDWKDVSGTKRGRPPKPKIV